MLRPCWVLPANILITVVLAPSTIIRAYLIFDRMILLFIPVDQLPAYYKRPNDKGEDIMIEYIMEFFYIMLAVSAVNLVFGTIRH